MLHVAGERALPLEAATTRTEMRRLLAQITVDHTDMAATGVAVCEHFATEQTSVSRLSVDTDGVDERK